MDETKETKETTWDREERLKSQRYENALAFLEKCKGEGLTIYEVEKTLEAIQVALKHRVTLEFGFDRQYGYRPKNQIDRKHE